MKRHLKILVSPNGDKFYYEFGVLHRINGPAVDCKCGYKEYYLNGVKYSFDRYMELSDNLKYLSRYRTHPTPP